jgi:LEA14-like dessication related protein
MGIVAIAVVLGACASLEEVVSTPAVSLAAVEVEKLDAAGQTFLLRFDVANPNPFPLPVSRISYGLELDGHRFVSGETDTAFSIPARGEESFAISVEANLLRSAPALIYAVSESIDRDVPYRVEGEFGVDLPYARPLGFQARGEVRLSAPDLRAQFAWWP